jgi:hypothetical protein
MERNWEKEEQEKGEKEKGENHFLRVAAAAAIAAAAIAAAAIVAAAAAVTLASDMLSVKLDSGMHRRYRWDGAHIIGDMVYIEHVYIPSEIHSYATMWQYIFLKKCFSFLLFIIIIIMHGTCMYA